MAQKKRSTGRTTPRRTVEKEEISSILGAAGTPLNRQQRRAVAQGKVKIPQDLLEQVVEMAEEHDLDLSTEAGREAITGPASPKLPAKAKLLAGIGSAAAVVLGGVAAFFSGSFAPLLGVCALLAVGALSVMTALGNARGHRSLGVAAVTSPVAAGALVVWERSLWGVAAVLGCGLATLVAVAVRRVFAPLPRLSAAHRTAVEKQRGVVSEIQLLGGIDTAVFPNGAIAVLGSVDTGSEHPMSHHEVRRFVSSSKRLMGGSGQGHVGTLVIVETPDFGPETLDGAVVCSASKLRNAPAALAAARR